MISDVADYSEWKNNRRATAIIFSAMLIGLKAGLLLYWWLTRGWFIGPLRVFSKLSNTKP